MKLDPTVVVEARERLGLTIEMAAERAEVSKNSISRAEHGLDIRPITARRIAHGLGLEVADLYPKAEAPTSWHRETAEERRVTAEQLRPAIGLMKTFNEKRQREIRDYDEGLRVPERTWGMEVEALEYMLTKDFEEQGLIESVEAVNEGRQSTADSVRRLSLSFDRELKLMRSLTREAQLIAGLAESRTRIEAIKGQTALDDWLSGAAREEQQRSQQETSEVPAGADVGLEAYEAFIQEMLTKALDKGALRRTES